MSNDNQLLVVTSAAAHTLIEDDLTSGLVDHLGQGRVALLREVRLTRMRSPQHSTDLHASSRDVGEDATDLSAQPIEQLITVAFPIREVHGIAPLQRHQHLIQATEILDTVDTYLDAVVLCPTSVVAASTVDLGGRVPPLFGSQEPVIEKQRSTFPRKQADRVPLKSDIDPWDRRTGTERSATTRRV